MIEAIRDALRGEMTADERVVLVGQDIGRFGGVFRATDGLHAEFGERRVFDMPLAEGAIIGSALGLAISGLRPVAEIQFLGFTHQAFHQIVSQVARMRYRSQGRFPASVVIRAPFGGGVKTPELHADAIESQYAHVPGLKVVAPSSPREAKGMLLTAMRDPDPVLFCEPLRGYRLMKEDVPSESYTLDIDKVRIVREGTDVTLIAWSAAVDLASRAADALLSEGVRAHVVDLRSIAPLDVDGLIAAAERTGRCVVIHEAPLTAGFGAEVAATISCEAFYALQAPVERVTGPDAPFPLAGAEQIYLPDVSQVVAAARRTLAAS